VCSDLERDRWSPALTIQKLVLALFSLMEAPEPDNAMRPDVAEVYKTDRALFERTAREWTRKYAK
jgi:ubiquitin-conjugating enzyme E2 D